MYECGSFRKAVGSFVTIDTPMTWRPMEINRHLFFCYFTGGVEVSKLPRLTCVVGWVADSMNGGLIVGVDLDLLASSRFFGCVLEGFCNPFQFDIVKNMLISDIGWSQSASACPSLCIHRR